MDGNDRRNSGAAGTPSSHVAPSRPIVLLVGGTDPSGGAGLAADLKAVAAMGGHGCIAVTAVTVQDSGRVLSWSGVDAGEVRAQMEAVFDDGPVHAVKTGMLAGPETVREVARVMRERREGGGRGHAFVLDPVMVAGSGDSLSGKGMEEVVRDELVPLASLCTPNLDEAARLTGLSVEDADGMERAARAIVEMGAEAALVKGGHLKGEPRDVLVVESSDEAILLPGRRIVDGKVHGTGCTLASALAALLGAGHPVEPATRIALTYLRASIRASFTRRRGTLLGHFPAQGPLPEAVAPPPYEEGETEPFYHAPRFCSRCGSEMVREPGQGPHLYCPSCGLVSYRNPLPASALLVSGRGEDEGKILLVRRDRAPARGALCLPGGFLEVGETVEECAIRELKEESGLDAKSLSLFDVETDKTAYGGIVLEAFEISDFEGEPRAGDDAAELHWVELDQVPKLAFRAHDRLVAKLRARRRR